MRKEELKKKKPLSLQSCEKCFGLRQSYWRESNIAEHVLIKSLPLKGEEKKKPINFKIEKKIWMLKQQQQQRIPLLSQLCFDSRMN